MGNVRRHYIEFKCMSSLDLTVSIVEADTTVSYSPFQFVIVLLTSCWHIHELWPVPE